MYCVMCCYTYSTKGSLQQTNVKILLLLFRNPTDAAHQLQQATKVDALCRAANVYSILPDSGWKRASVWIMLIHNVSAFTLHTNPLLYMWERLIRTHHHPWYIRLPSRIPVCKPLLFSSPPALFKHLLLCTGLQGPIHLHGCLCFLNSDRLACHACIIPFGNWVVSHARAGWSVFDTAYIGSPTTCMYIDLSVILNTLSPELTPPMAGSFVLTT